MIHRDAVLQDLTPGFSFHRTIPGLRRGRDRSDRNQPEFDTRLIRATALNVAMQDLTPSSARSQLTWNYQIQSSKVSDSLSVVVMTEVALFNLALKSFTKVVDACTTKSVSAVVN